MNCFKFHDRQSIDFAQFIHHKNGHRIALTFQLENLIPKKIYCITEVAWYRFSIPLLPLLLKTKFNTEKSTAIKYKERDLATHLNNCFTFFMWLIFLLFPYFFLFLSFSHEMYLMLSVEKKGHKWRKALKNISRYILIIHSHSKAGITTLCLKVLWARFSWHDQWLKWTHSTSYIAVKLSRNYTILCCLAEENFHKIEIILAFFLLIS